MNKKVFFNNNNKNIKGVLETGNNKVEVYAMELENNAIRKINDMRERKRIDQNNQKFNIQSITINPKDEMIFVKGQSALQKTSNGFAMPADFIGTPQSFKGVFRTFTFIDDCYMSCELIIDKLEFDFRKSRKEMVCEDRIEYRNVSGIVSPFGSCTLQILDNDEE